MGFLLTYLLKSGLDSQTTKLKEAIEILSEKNTLLKKQIVLTFFMCYYHQKQHLTSLCEQVERQCEPLPAAASEEVAFNVLSEAEKQMENSENVAEPEPQPANLEIDFDMKNEKEPVLEKKDSQFGKKEDPLVKLNQGSKRATFDTFWFNKMLDVFFIEWARSAYFRVILFFKVAVVSYFQKERMVKKLLKSLNKRKQKYKFVKEFNVKEFIVSLEFYKQVYHLFSIRWKKKRLKFVRLPCYPQILKK